MARFLVFERGNDFNGFKLLSEIDNEETFIDALNIACSNNDPYEPREWFIRKIGSNAAIGKCEEVDAILVVRIGD